MTSIFKKTLDEIDAEIDVFYDRARAELKASIRKSRYDEYMQSGTWRDLRGLKLDLASHRCERCGATDELHVHHLTYERFGGDELLTDLQVLCRDCPNMAHGRTF